MVPDHSDIFRRVTDHIVAVDRSWILTYVNEPAAKAMDCTPEELIGRTLWDVFPAFDGTDWEAYYRKALETQTAVGFEARETSDGRWFDVRVYPSADGLTIYRNDITDRKALEKALRESEELYRKVFSLMSEAFGLCEVVRDSSGKVTDFCFVQVNKAFGSLTSVPPEVARRRTLSEVLPGVKDQWIECFSRVSESGNSVRFQSRDALTNRWYEVFAYQVGPRHLAHLFIDITETKKSETMLRRHEETLQELNENLERRVAERTALAERRAFELRQLVEELGHTEQRTRINLAQILHDHLQQLLAAAKFRVRSLQYVSSPSDLAEETRQLEGLINDAIDEARSVAAGLSPPILQERGLAAGLEWLCRQLEDEHGLKVSLTVEPGSEPDTEDIKMFLFQAARELLLNVVRHAGVGQAELAVAGGPPGFLRLTVKDRGIGFDASKVIVRSPSGFGLFNIQQRLELLGGALEIRSEPGSGCEISLTAPVPLQPPLAPRILPPRDQPGDLPPQAPGSEGQPTRVMLVDDHEILREGLANLLESNSQIKVVGGAGDGAVAVEMARKLKPDVILMDITMPTMNGIDATRCIKAELPECRIIALSMHEREDMEVAMREAGAIAYISKDVPWDELNSVIQRIVTEKQ